VTGCYEQVPNPQRKQGVVTHGHVTNYLRELVAMPKCTKMVHCSYQNVPKWYILFFFIFFYFFLFFYLTRYCLLLYSMRKTTKYFTPRPKAPQTRSTFMVTNQQEPEVLCEKAIGRFIELLTTGFKDAPVAALYKVGLYTPGEHKPTDRLRAAMDHPRVKEALSKYGDWEKSHWQTMASLRERLLVLAKIVRDGAKFIDTKGVIPKIKDPKSAMAAIAELNKIEGSYAPVKSQTDLTSKDGSMTPRTLSKKEMLEYHALFEKEY